MLAILSILVGSAIPILSPANDRRRVREAARGLNAYLTGAQTRAIETGRPFGVRLRKLSRDTGRDADSAVAIEVSYIEVPPPFAGFDESSRVMFGSDQDVTGAAVTSQVLMRFVAAGNSVAPAVDGLPPGLDPDPIVPSLIRQGDTIEVDGRVFLLIDDANGGAALDSEGFYTTGYGVPENSLFVRPVNGTVFNLQYRFDNTGNPLVDPFRQPARYWTEPKPYQISRQPTPTSNEPYQLPDGTAIDLRASGVGGVPFYEDDEEIVANNPPQTPTNPTTSNNTPVDILFSPEGTIEGVRYDLGPQTTSAPDPAVNPTTTDTLYLLVGSSLSVSGAAAEADFGGPAGQGTDAEVQDRKAIFNWLNADSRWVTVGARTGTVRTSPNSFVDPVAIARQTAPQDLTNFPGDLTARRALEIARARTLADEGAGAGGR